MTYLPGLEPPSPPTDAHDGDGDEWYTPPEVLRAVRSLTHDGRIDLDPCHAPRSLTDPRHRIDVRDGGDGLTDPWPGGCCCNPHLERVGLQNEEHDMHKVRNTKASDNGVLFGQQEKVERPGFLVQGMPARQSQKRDGTKASGPIVGANHQGAKSPARKIRKGAGDEKERQHAKKLPDKADCGRKSHGKGDALRLGLGEVAVNSGAMERQVRLLRARGETGTGPLYTAVESRVPGNNSAEYGSCMHSLQQEQGGAASVGLAGRKQGKACRHCGGTSSPGLVFVNCPYSNVGPWLDRCRREAARRPVVMLIPMRPETAAWWTHVWGAGGYLVVQRGRLRFVGPTGERHGNGMITTCFVTWSEALAVSLAEALVREGIDAVAVGMLPVLPW